MTKDTLIFMSDETIDKKLDSLYHDGVVDPYRADQIKILLAEKNRRLIQRQGEINSKISIRSLTIALIALFISLVLIYFSIHDNRLDKQRFEVLKEIRDNINEVDNVNWKTFVKAVREGIMQT